MIINNIPLTINVSKNKKVSLNINTYRNLCFHANNNLKKRFALHIKLNGQIFGSISTPPYEFLYTIYRRDNKRTDLMNIASVVDKFVSDSLVILKYIADDNTDIIKKVTVVDGGIDKLNPHARLEIKHYETV